MQGRKKGKKGVVVVASDVAEEGRVCFQNTAAEGEALREKGGSRRPP